MNKIVHRIFTMLIIIGLLYLCLYNSDNNKDNKKTTILDTNSLLNIYFFDVGEADSTLIQYKDNNILIDGGNTVDGVLLVPYLKELGINHFDAVFATHAHEDHIGGLSRVVYNFSIDRFFMPNHKAEWKSYDNLVKALDKRNLEHTVPHISEEIHLDDLVLTILWVGESEDYNENSIIVKLKFNNTRYLFMADAESDVERMILDEDIKSDVLKVGHHGSKYASSATFLEKVHPKYSIISCGANNEYGHPHQVVLDKLEYINSTIYRTDVYHTIHLISDGNNINFQFLDKSFNGGDL